MTYLLGRTMKWRFYYEKLLWLRVQKGWSQEEAAEACHIYKENKRQYIRLESGETRRPRQETIQNIADGFGLNNINELIIFPGEKPDEEITFFYNSYKNKSSVQLNPKSHPPKSSGISLVAFDVDNTILKGFEFSWQAVWKYLGYDDAVRRAAMKKYLSGQLSYPEWCNYCCHFFRKKNLSKSDLHAIVGQYSVIKGFRSTLKRIRKNGIKTAIVSGGIDQFLEILIPDYKDIFDFVFINKFVFNKEGLLQEIYPTDYDFEGKLTCIKNLCSLLGLTLSQAAFVGEGFNDKFLGGEIGLTIALSPKSQEVAQLFDIIIEEEDMSRILSPLGLEQNL